MNKRIHIVSFDVPIPPDYGGVLDVYLRAKALKSLGYFVILHCYEYGRGRTHQFSDVAHEIYYYDRETGLASFFSILPYIVRSRSSKALLKRLLKDEDPIVLEGQHSTYWINELVENNRQLAIRIHNVEWQYYRQLAKNAKSFRHRLFYVIESRKLKRHERQLKKIQLLCISKSDLDYYQKQGFRAIYLPVTGNRELVLTPGKDGGFALYHGNLSISENQKAIDLLIQENQRSKLPLPVVVAGKNPDRRLVHDIEAQGWQCIANPGDEELNELMRNCSLHLITGSKSTGMKLKVLRALFSGKPCIANSDVIDDPVLQKHFIVWDPVSPLAELMSSVQSPEPTAIEQRIQELTTEFGVAKLQAVMREIGFEG